MARESCPNPAGPSLAAVVPTLDEASQLPSLLASLRGPEWLDSAQEIIVSDGGSADATATLATRHGANLVTGEPGRGGQLARGAARARSELLLFLHADARLRPGSLRAVRAAFEDPELVATGMCQRIDHPGRIFRWIERMANRRVSWGWIYGDSGLVCRREAYERVGGFRPLPIFEDLDLSRRLKRAGRVGLVSGAFLTVSSRRWEREGPLRRTIKNWCLTLAWAVGVAPERLARFYPPHGNSKDRNVRS